MGYVPAYFFYRSESRYKQAFLLLIMLPFWVSFIIRTMSWINIMGDSGLINHFLMKIGLIQSPISMLYNEFTVLMGLIMYLLPFMVLNIYVSLEGIDKSLLEAARCMGCTEWQAFREVTLPLSLPGVSAGCLIEIPGDVNSSGSITSSDAITMVGYVFKGGPPPEPCEANGDVNCDGAASRPRALRAKPLRH